MRGRMMLLAAALGMAGVTGAVAQTSGFAVADQVQSERTAA